MSRIDDKRKGPAVLAAGLAALALLLAPGPAIAHDKEKHLSDARPELELGRSADYDYDPPVPGSYRLPAIKAAGDGAVLDARGRERRLHEVMAGRITLLSFIYTRCADPQGCPLATALLYDIAEVSRQDPLLAENLRLVSLSFDPAHDTPEVMADYAGGSADAPGEAAEWLYLTTRSEAELAPILASYGQLVGRMSDAADPFGALAHQLRVYLIDRQGRIRNIYSLGFLDPRLVITDVLNRRQGQREDPVMVPVPADPARLAGQHRNPWSPRTWAVCFRRPHGCRAPPFATTAERSTPAATDLFRKWT